MSLNNDLDDLEAQADSAADDTTRRSSSTTNTTEEESSLEFASLITAISQRTHLITSNVSQIHRFIGFLGTPRDTDKRRSSLLDSLSRTKVLCAQMLPDIRTLTKWSGDKLSEGDKDERTKLVSEFQKGMSAFQYAQRLALEKYIEFVRDIKALIDEENEEFEVSPDGRGQQLKQRQKLLEGIDSDETVDMNERLIKEREVEIEGIETGIAHVDEILRAFSNIVLEQGSLWDESDENTRLLGGGKSRDPRLLAYRKGAAGWCCWLLVVFIMITIAIVPFLVLRL